MNHEKWTELADLYAVGALDGGDLAEFESHFHAGCPACEFRISENENLLGGMLQQLPHAQVPAALKSRLMDAVEIEETPSQIGFMMTPAAAAGIWVLVSAFILWGWQTTSGNRRFMEVKRMEEVMSRSPEMKTVELKPMEPGAASPMMAKVMWNAKGECVLMTLGLPKISRDKSYQIWGIKGEEKISMGVFSVDQHGCALMTMKQIQPGSFEKLAVTLEPAGGRPSPTGPIVLLGSVGK